MWCAQDDDIYQLTIFAIIHHLSLLNTEMTSGSDEEGGGPSKSAEGSSSKMADTVMI